MIKRLLLPEVDGYFLDGFHINGPSATTIDLTSVTEIVERCISLIPEEKMRVMLGAYDPVATLQLIRLGVDVFDSTYAYLASLHNCALTFNFDLDNPVEGSVFDLDMVDVK